LKERISRYFFLRRKLKPNRGVGTFEKSKATRLIVPTIHAGWTCKV
jgi:hypothetical protein